MGAWVINPVISYHERLPSHAIALSFPLFKILFCKEQQAQSFSMPSRRPSGLITGYGVEFWSYYKAGRLKYVCLYLSYRGLLND
jgi:hypothetical protein